VAAQYCEECPKNVAEFQRAICQNQYSFWESRYDVTNYRIDDQLNMEEVHSRRT